MFLHGAVQLVMAHDLTWCMQAQQGNTHNDVPLADIGVVSGPDGFPIPLR